MLDVACHLNVVAPDASPAHLPEALAALAAVGYRRVVLPPLDAEATDVAFVRGAFESAGLSPITIAGVGPATDVSSPDADEREAGAASLRRYVDFTVSLGGDQMNGTPYGLFGHPAGPTSREAFERSAAQVGRVADYAHEQGVMMTFEVLNRYETSLVNTATQAMSYVEASGSEHLRIHLDTFHMAVEEADIAGAIVGAISKLGFLELGQSGRGPLEHGAVGVAEIVERVSEAGYAGRWGVEAFSRSVLPPEVAGMLAIWRSPYEDGATLAASAFEMIERAAGSRAADRG
ncbi:MAG TPA: sugar phosphate isomerase/epimerase family protein [Microbacterium sp.]|nr:sugar phosphate isomerase/epimerase family protein [Microbacterium sp.]